MRSHAKAPSAGSTKRQATGLGRIFRGVAATRGASPASKGSGASRARALVLAASVLALVLALVVGTASALQTHNFKEVFGSAEQPEFPADKGLAIDQGSEELHVIDSTDDVLYRFDPDGTAANFGALGENVIDGEGGADETPDGNVRFSSNRQREQVAIDESGEATDGNIYVTESARDQVTIFAANGEYLGQLTESTAGGAFGEPCGVAVDENGLVYVGDRGDDMIHVFEPAANPPVNGDNSASFETLTDPCTLAAGTEGSAGFLFVNTSTAGDLFKLDAASGEIKYEILSSGGSTVTVNPASGNVFAARDTGTSSAVDEFDASGAEVGELELLSTILPGSTVEGVAVNGASGEIYLSRSSTSNVEIYDDPIVTQPEVVTEEETSNTGTSVTMNGTVDPDGVELSECFFEWGENVSGSPVYGETAPCAETPAEIGAGESPIAVHADVIGLAPQDTDYEYRLVAVNPESSASGANETFTTPDTVITEAASAITDTEATLNGTVNPDTAAISECIFEWGEEKGPLEEFQTFPETAPCVPGPGGITGESPVAVEADLSGLHPGTAYLYRLKAAYPTGPATGDTETVQTAGPRIADSWAEDIVYTEAIFKAEIDPEGTATTYRFEWGPTTAYGDETEELNVGSDSSVHTLSRFLDDLTPGTTYHWRVVATSAAGVNEGPDHEIRTFRRFKADTDCPNQVNRYGAGGSLPDCRAYEMVSPLDKNNGDIEAARDSDTSAGNARSSRTQTTPSGGKLTYTSYRAFADAQSVPWVSQYIARRVGGGDWRTHSINQPGGSPLFSSANVTRAQYQVFSENLCQGWMRSYFDSPGFETIAGVTNLYQRKDRLCGPEGFQPLAPLAPPLAVGGNNQFSIQGTSGDGSHLIFAGPIELVPEGNSSQFQLYESPEPGAPPRLVCILPNEEAHPGACTAGGGTVDPFGGSRTGAISEDGERIFWTDNVDISGSEGGIYVRIGGTETVAVSQAGEEAAGTTDSFFWGAASDGSRAVYTTGDFDQPALGRSHLYAFDVDSETTEPIAAGVYGVAGISEDARRVYFASQEALPGGGQNSEGDEAVEGQPNLYFYDADVGGGTSTFLGTLSSLEATTPDIVSGYSLLSRAPVGHLARVTSDGLHLAFSSYASLTGYDNRRGEAAESPNRLAYVYDAQSDELICASCVPSGARGPIRERSSDSKSAFEAQIPISGYEFSAQPSRLLSPDGSRLFLESANALDPRDTNAKVDLYQWEQAGTGGCDASDSRYAPSAQGCIELISTGTADLDVQFAEASTDGDDVFFYTKSSLVPQDYGLVDIYDARVGGGSPPPPEPPDCFGDACQGIPSAPDDPTPASAGFKGAGDPVPQRNCGAAARRATKLSRRAKRLRRAAKRSSNPKRSKQMRRKSVRFAKNAKRLSRNAKRCRRANRRASR